MISFQLKNLMDSINDNTITKSKKITINKLSKQTGIARTSLRALYNGSSKGVEFVTLNKLIEYFNVSLNQLMNYSANIKSMIMYKVNYDNLPKDFKTKYYREILQNTMLLGIDVENNSYDLKIGTFNMPTKNKIPLFYIMFDREHTQNPLTHLDDNSTKIIASIILFSTIKLENYKNNQKIEFHLSPDNMPSTLGIGILTKNEIIKNSKINKFQAYYKNSDDHFTVQNKIK